ncbi:hypothetical protein K438DRAFT_750761 [Mycena galopus ATCC 62051]|nr:hypothetical protein K438DRAFT_750761 [Mycena galopus ATCC 62051]
MGLLCGNCDSVITIACLSSSPTAFEMLVMSITFKYPDVKDFTHATPWFTAAMAMAIAAETIISVSMTVILKARRTEVKGTNTAVNRLITYTKSTGVLTSVFDIFITSDDPNNKSLNPPL